MILTTLLKLIIKNDFVSRGGDSCRQLDLDSVCGVVLKPAFILQTRPQQRIVVG